MKRGAGTGSQGTQSQDVSAYRPYKKSRYSKRNFQTVARIPRRVVAKDSSFNPFPTSQMVKFRYCQSVNINPAAGLTASHLFIANGLYDPDYTGTGHQPYGFDQWMAIYNHYIVESAVITVQFVSSATSASASTCNAVVGIALKDDTTVETDLNNIREVKGSKSIVVPMQECRTLKNYFNKKAIFKDSEDGVLRGTASANPSETCIFQVFVTPVDTTADVLAMACVVTIDYTARLFELKDFGGS